MTKCPQCGGRLGGRWSNRCYQCNGRPRTGKKQRCKQCKKWFYVSGWELMQEKQGPRRFCSRSCKNDAQRGQEIAPGGSYVRPDGYIAVKVGIRQYELQHRLVVEAHLGRELSANEHVHHINGDKQDNRLENLIVLTNSDHQKLHGPPHRRRTVTGL